jgi:hypothetical protein
VTSAVRIPVLLVAALVVAAGCSDDDDAASTTTSTTEAAVEVRLNEIQVLGSHNSYHLRPDEEILEAVAAFAGQDLAAGFDYQHRPIREQLEDFGVRQVEIDVYADPEGGRFARRPALDIIGLPVESGEPELEEPGFKVIHQADVDFNSSCLTFVDCLDEVRSWSEENADHEPVMIMVEAKQESVEEAVGGSVDISGLGIEFTQVVPFDRAAFDRLEAEILSVFDRSDIITPDDVRGGAGTLEEAVLAGDAWPTLEDSAGKVLFSLVDLGATRDVYAGDAPSLEGRLMFTSSEEGRPDAAFIRVDDPVAEGARIRELVRSGYLVRTRTDVPGVDAPADDTTRRDAAIASGAQYLSTDYYVEEPLLANDYVVDLPGDAPARCNPVNAPEGCALG